MRIFRRKKAKKDETTATVMTSFEKLCVEDKELYDALCPVMLLDPRKVEVSMKQAAINAKKCEKEDNLAGARMWYRVAGGLAIYEGNVEKVVEYFEDLERITGRKYLILKNPEKAVAKAQEYYKQYLTT